MKRLTPLLSTLLLGLATTTFASGSRTQILTEAAIENASEIAPVGKAESPGGLHYAGSLDGIRAEQPLDGRGLSYIGTFDKRWHVLMDVRTTLPSPPATGSPMRPMGMPMDTVFTYRIAADAMTVVNGWELAPYVSGNGIEIDPNLCPGIQFEANRTRYTLPKSSKSKAQCLAKIRAR